jgi:hypothetical protein
LFDVIDFTLIPEKYFSDICGWRSSKQTFCHTSQSCLAPICSCIKAYNDGSYYGKVDYRFSEIAILALIGCPFSVFGRYA